MKWHIGNYAFSVRPCEQSARKNKTADILFASLNHINGELIWSRKLMQFLTALQEAQWRKTKNSGKGTLAGKAMIFPSFDLSELE